MGVSNGVGISDATPYKQKILKEIIRKHLYACDGIFKKHPYYWKHYLYIDATAGTGTNSSSPLIFLETSNEIKPCFSEFIYFIDKRKKALEELHQNIKLKLDQEHGNMFPLTQKPFAWSIQFKKGKYQKVIPNVIHWKPEPNAVTPEFGLIYFDPNGVVDLGFLEQISKDSKMKKIDILFNYNATAFKRSEKAFDKKEDFICLLHKINKRFWYIREPVGKWQWSFLYGCNSECFKLSKGLDFYDIDSARGKEILYKLNYTKAEYKNPNQLKLW